MFTKTFALIATAATVVLGPAARAECRCVKKEPAQ